MALTVQQYINALYITLYDRAADSNGYNFWVATLGLTPAQGSTTNITSAQQLQLATQFVNTQSTYFNTQYGALSNSQYIEALYQNLGGTAGDSGGVSFWTVELNKLIGQGKTQIQARTEIAARFTNDLLDINLANVTGLTPAELAAAQARQDAMQNKLAVSIAYQTNPDPILNSGAVGDAAFQAATRALDGVTNDPATRTDKINQINAAATADNLALITGAPVSVTTFTLTSNAPTVVEGNNGVTAMIFQLSLDRAPVSDVVINFATSTSGTATSGSDFVASSGTVTFAAGQTNATVAITINGDTAFEANETIQVNFTGAALTAPLTATGTINNDDADPATFVRTLTVDAPTVVEGNAGTSNLIFTLTLDQPAAVDTLINYSTLGTGTATAGDDFNAVSGSVTILAGQTSAQVTVTVKGDTVFENAGVAETVNLTFSGALLTAPVNATGSINNDDVDPDTVPLSLALTTNATDVVEGKGAADTIIGQVGQITTLQGSDKIDGKAGIDTLRVTTDNTVTGFNVTGAAVQGFKMDNVEVLEVQAQALADVNGAGGYPFSFNGTVLGLENVDANLGTIRSSSSTGGLLVKNVNSIAALEIQNNLNNNADIILSYKVGVLAGGADTQSIALNGNNIRDIQVGQAADNAANTANAGIETVNLSSTGAASTVNDLNFAFGTLNITGDKNLTVATDLDNAVRTVNAGTFTGNLTISSGDAGAGNTIAITSGSGNDILSVATNTGTSNVNAGAGDDLILLGTNLDPTDVINGGIGRDVIAVEDIANVNAGDSFKNLSQVEVLRFTTSTNGVFDGGAFNNPANLDGTGATAGGIEEFDLAGGMDGNVTLDGVKDDALIKVNAQAGGHTNGHNLTVTHVADTSADDLRVQVAFDNADTFGTVTVNDTETLNLTSNSQASGNVLTVGTLAGNDLTSVTLAGTGRVVVTNTITTGAIASINASGQTGGVSLTVDDATDVSAGTAQNLTVTGSAAGDNLTLGGANNFGVYTVNSGAGTDTVNLTSAAAAAVTHSVTASGNGIINVVGAAAGLNATLSGTSWLVVTDDGVDTIDASASTGTNSFLVNGGNDVVKGGSGADTIDARNYTGQVLPFTGVEGVDNFSGGAGNDTFIFGWSNNPASEGLTSADTVAGGEGTDRVRVDANNSVINLNDSIFNNWTSVEEIDIFDSTGAVLNHSLTLNAIAQKAGVERVFDHTGNDTINVGEGFSSALLVDISEGGDDTLVGTNATGAITVRGQTSDFTAADTLTGGKSTADTLELVFEGGQTAVITGATNFEAIKFTSNSSVVAATDTVVIPNALTTGASFTADASALNANEGVVINGLAETSASLLLTGGAGADTLYGGTRADTLVGGSGADKIYGGAGADVLTGGAGNDKFYFTAADAGPNSIDNITDFQAGDTIVYPFAITYRGSFANFAAGQGAISLGGGVEAVYLQDQQALWIDVNDDGTLNANDLQIQMDGTNVAFETGTLALVGGANYAVNFTANATNNVFKNGVNEGSVNAAAVGPMDTLTLGGTSTIGNVTGFQIVTLENNSNLTISKAQHDAFLGATTVTATGNQTVVLTDAYVGNADSRIEAYGLANAVGNDITLTAVGQDVTGNADDDIVRGGVVTNANVLAGGAQIGTDTLFVTDDVNGSTNELDNVTGFERIEIANTNASDYVALDTLIATGATLVVQQTVAGGDINFNASAESDGALIITTLGGDDTIQTGAGGNQNDVVNSGAGNDTIIMGDGMDIVNSDAGNDTINFSSNLTSLDFVNGGADSDTLSITDGTAASDLNGVTNVEFINISSTGASSYTSVDTLVGAGATLTVTQVTNQQLTFNGAAETNGKFAFILNNSSDTVTGGAGDDVFTAGAGDDNLSGNGGNDEFRFAGNLTNADQVNGGANTDTLLADNVNLTLNAGVVNIETLTVTNTDGAADSLTTVDANVAAAAAMAVNLVINSTGNTTFNGSAETNGTLNITVSGTGTGTANITLGGAGSTNSVTGTTKVETVTMSGGTDTLNLGDGNDIVNALSSLSAADTVNGQGGSGDTLNVVDDTATTDLNGVTGFETLNISSTNASSYTTVDTLVDAGATLTVTQVTAQDLTFNGSAETNGKFVFVGNTGVDTLTGGAGDDTFNTNTGNDVLVGGGGADTFNFTAAGRIDNNDTVTGGTGLDILNVTDGTLLAADLDGVTQVETINLTITGGALTVTEGLTAAGVTTTVNVTATSAFVIDTTAETNGNLTFNLVNATAADTITTNQTVAGATNNLVTINGAGLGDTIATLGDGGTTYLVDIAGAFNAVTFSADVNAALIGLAGYTGNADNIILARYNGAGANDIYAVVDLTGNSVTADDALVHIVGTTRAIDGTMFS
jgi:Ca2+-binding RTX toxin-like protein